MGSIILAILEVQVCLNYVLLTGFGRYGDFGHHMATWTPQICKMIPFGLCLEVLSHDSTYQERLGVLEGYPNYPPFWYYKYT